MLFSVYVDGLSDRITMLKLKSIFEQAGRVKDVFVQFKKKFQRCFRYGFVRFQNDEEAWQAIQMFNGLRLEGNYLVVKHAHIKQPNTRVKRGSPAKNFAPKQDRGQIWRPKAQLIPTVPEQIVNRPKKKSSVQKSENERQPGVGHLSFSGSNLNHTWYQRCARARTLEAKPIDVLQDELARIGMYNFRFIPLGADEVLLEFESKEELDDTLAECRVFLEQKLSELKPCTSLTFGVAHLVWIRLWQCYTMSVDMEGTSCVILVEKEDKAYDYGTMESMPSTPVKIYNSDDATDFGDDSENNDDIIAGDEGIFDNLNDDAVDIESGEEDEVFRNEIMEGLQSMQGVIDHKSASDSQNVPGWSFLDTNRETQPGEAAHVLPEVVVAHDRLEQTQMGDHQKNSNSNAINGTINSEEEFREQLQVLEDSGYTVEEIEAWKRNKKTDDIKINQKQIFPFLLKYPDLFSNNQFSVTGYSFNTQDMPQKYSWDPLQVQSLLKPCLPQVIQKNNDFLWFAAYLAKYSSPAFHVNAQASQETYVRVSPHQIVRQNKPAIVSLPQPCLQQEQQTPLNSFHIESSDLSTPTPYNSPNTNSSKKSSQRGRPKGSKNKPIEFPEDFLEPVTGEDGVTTRAQRAWLLGQQLGLKPRGSEALMLRSLEAQIRANHPHLN
ncbi:uncharacterized protein LOC130724581 isoform X2 [Lotus japonicus]|uniref:uncharacterized protein LOC130724581 isoform X2 n=1 Tax=Lotus japonicus TaxID=34305 RepID=UPI00258FCFBD|nr:uncharacterized protein LOC130724581 isoform X2 [Lotus japonicus]